MSSRSGSFVIVNGKWSHPIRLRNIAFQGTVWGPSRWNAFFGDCGFAIRACGFDLVVYADDLNAFKFNSRSVINRAIKVKHR